MTRSPNGPLMQPTLSKPRKKPFSIASTSAARSSTARFPAAPLRRLFQSPSFFFSRLLPFRARLRNTAAYNGNTVTESVQYGDSASGPIGFLLETRVGGVASENATAIRPGCWVSSTLRWGSWQIYDGTAADRLVGLDYFGARYFSGAMGRFTSPDEPSADQHPSDPQSWNLYSYARNNPLRYFDPTGRDCVSTDGGKTFHDENAGESTCSSAQNAQFDVTGTAYAAKTTAYGTELYEKRNSGNRLIYESGACVGSA